MLKTLDWIIIATYIVLIVIVGLIFRKKAGNSLSDFFLGGRNLPWWLAGLSMVATTFAADTPLVVTELVGQSGIAGNWLWWNMLIGGMLTTFFFARLWRRANVLTELEFIKIRYSGKKVVALRGTRAIYIALVMNVLIIAWVNVALMTIINVFFGVEGDALLWIMFAAMFMAAIYTTVSGLKGIAVTDAIQFFIAMFGAIILAVLVISSDKIGGISGLKSSLPETAFSFFPDIGGKGTVGVLSLSVGSFLAYGLVQWWASWYPGAEPGGGGYIAQRMMSTKNEKHSIFATLFFQIAHYAIRPWPWIMVGLAAIVLYPNIAAVDLRFGYVYAMRDFLPVGLKGLMLVGFLAAYMSTISTQLNFGSSILTNDFFLLFKKKDKSDEVNLIPVRWIFSILIIIVGIYFNVTRAYSFFSKDDILGIVFNLVLMSSFIFVMRSKEQKNHVSWGRFFTVLIMVFSIIVTSKVETISGVWTFMIECGAGLGLVLILRWYWWRINAWSEFFAMIVPFVIYGVIQLVKFNNLLPLHVQYGDFIPEDVMKVFKLANPLLFFPGSFFLTVGGTTISWLLVTFLTKPTDRKILSDFYNKIQPQGWWKPFGENKVSGNIAYLLGSWLTSIVLVYSTLFIIGKVILAEWTSVIYLFIVVVIAFIGFMFFVKRAKIFD